MWILECWKSDRLRWGSEGEAEGVNGQNQGGKVVEERGKQWNEHVHMNLNDRTSSESKRRLKHLAVSQPSLGLPCDQAHCHEARIEDGIQLQSLVQ